MQEAGIRPSQRARRVGDYRLDELLLEGPNYQDWTARHAAIESERARVRIYAVARSASDDERAACQRAARREYEILRDVRHEGILAAKGYTEHVLGPALVFEHRDGFRRFDHWLADRAATLDVDTRLHLLRQIAEAVRMRSTWSTGRCRPRASWWSRTRRSRGSGSSTGRRGRAGRATPGRRDRRRRGRAVSTRSWRNPPGSTWRPRR